MLKNAENMAESYIYGIPKREYFLGYGKSVLCFSKISIYIFGEYDII